MTRLTVDVPPSLYHKILKIAKQREDSISKVIKQFIEAGIYEMENNYSALAGKDKIEQHCHQLDIQSNALLKKVAMKLLDLSLEDLETFKELSEKKYIELSRINV
jgi:predicted DNA-binding protein